MGEFIGDLISAESTLAEHKRMATGIELTRLPVGMLASSVATEAEFDGLISTVYRWYWDQLRIDRMFLERYLRADEKKDVRDFDALLRTLRHAVQHAESEHSMKRKAWLLSFVVGDLSNLDWNLCAAEVMRSLSRALGAYAIGAHLATMRTEYRQEWAARCSQTPEIVVATVFQDLGMTIGGHQFRYQVSQFETSPNLRNARNHAERLAYAEAQVAGANFRALPVPYQDILREMELVGQPMARSALLVAHAVSDIRGLEGQALIAATSKAWLGIVDGS